MESVFTFSRERQAWVVIPSHSLISVFIKSLHLLAAAWVLVVTYLWLAIDPDLRVGDNLLAHAALPAAAIEALAFGVTHWAKSFGRRISTHHNEWGYAVSWTAVPVAFLICGVLLITA